MGKEEQMLHGDESMGLDSKERRGAGERESEEERDVISHNRRYWRRFERHAKLSSDASMTSHMREIREWARREEVGEAKERELERAVERAKDVKMNGN